MSHENIVCRPKELLRFYVDAKTLADRPFSGVQIPLSAKHKKKHPYGCFF